MEEKLYPHSYTPQVIMDKVRQNASLPGLTNHQLKCKETIVSLYRSWMGFETARLHNMCGDLQIAMEALDGFFFTDSLTSTSLVGPGRRIASPIVSLLVERNVFKNGHPGNEDLVNRNTLPWGRAVSVTNDKLNIYIDTFRHGSLGTMADIMETLVHEMAHAAMIVFMCKCKHCNGAACHSDILGPHGHGRLWIQMMEFMRTTIRGWDSGLAGFSTRDIYWLLDWELEPN